jgi:hypothetical protein
MNVMYRLIFKFEHEGSQRSYSSLLVDLHQVLLKLFQTTMNVDHLGEMAHSFDGIPDLGLSFLQSNMGSHDGI